jgi:hypothetical protein
LSWSGITTFHDIAQSRPQHLRKPEEGKIKGEGAEDAHAIFQFRSGIAHFV